MKQRLRGTYVRSMALAGFAELVELRGGDAGAILHEVGLDRAVLADGNGLIGWGAFGSVLEIAAKQLDAPNFGFDLAMALPDLVPSAAALVLMAEEGQTMLDWFRASATHWRYYTNGYRVHVRPNDDGSVALRLDFPQHSFTPRHGMELTFATFCRLRRTLCGDDDSPAWVHFRHRAPADIERHAELFGPGLAFGQSHFEIGFTPAQWQTTMAPTAARKRALVDWLVRRRIESMADYDQSISHTVGLTISSILGAGVCNLEFVAASLDLSPKKLQRLLAQEGTNFSQLLDAVREQVALRLLTDTEMGIALIAGLLDYAGTAPFSLAVRRWFGMSPMVVRRRSLHEEFESRPVPQRPSH